MKQEKRIPAFLLVCMLVCLVWTHLVRHLGAAAWIAPHWLTKGPDKAHRPDGNIKIYSRSLACTQVGVLWLDPFVRQLGAAASSNVIMLLEAGSSLSDTGVQTKHTNLM